MTDLHPAHDVRARRDAVGARRRLFADLDVTERTLDVGGISTTVVEGGLGSPLVLLHGQGGSAVAWLPVMSRLLGGHRLIVPDLPGLGESEDIGAGLDAGRAAAWLDRLIAATCDRPPTVVGTSLGGTLAALHAIRHPGSSRRIVLVDSGSLGSFRPDPRVLPALIRLAVRPTEPNIERLFRYTVADLDRFKLAMGDRWSDFLAYGRERNATPAVQGANRRWLRRLGTRRIPDAQLAGISAPVALIWGRHDRVMKLGIAEAAAARFGWPLQVIDDAGHAVIWDQPAAFVAALEATLV